MAYQLTPEQLALSLARKKKKEEAAAANAAQKQDASATVFEKISKNPAAKVLTRGWLNNGQGRSDSTILVATWNVSCLKWLSMNPTIMFISNRSLRRFSSVRFIVEIVPSLPS